MSTNLPLKRGALEGAVIVVSVLLALAADAWWDNRQAAQLESYVLDAVAEEVSENQAILERDRQSILTQLSRTEFFLHSSPATLARLPQDSVQPIVGSLTGPVTFDPLSGAAGLLSQTAVLSPRGLEVRALVSQWLTRVADATEEKERFRERNNVVQILVAPYAARTAQGPMGGAAERLASLGSTVLGEIRSDPAIVEAVILRSSIEAVYLNNLEALRQVLDSLDWALASM